MSELLANVCCVAIDGRAILISGEPGSGKSSLALALIDRGAVLVGDDGVMLQEEAGQVRAAPPPRILGQLEIRNVGIVHLPTTSGTLALAVRLDASAPRFIEAASSVTLAGRIVPQVALYPETSALPLRVEWALRLHGRR